MSEESQDFDSQLKEETDTYRADRDIIDRFEDEYKKAEMYM